MKLYKIYLVLILTIPFFIQAQYLGGNGRGDASITLTNVPLPVDETPYYSPTEFDLGQNFPNPFNPKTVIGYQLSVISNVTLKVYDVLGNEIATLVNEEKPAGVYEALWSAEGLPSGIYFCRLITSNFSETIKMLVLK